jgi:hypothetical protein
MGATKKPRKRYTPRTVDRDPIARLRAVPQQDRAALYLRQVTALESIARCSVASRAEIAELADCINTLQTMVETMSLLDASECMPIIEAASHALRDAAHRNSSHGVARVDGPGLQALREAVELFETVSANASHRTMSHARDLTEHRVRQLLRNPRPDTIILEA